MNRVFIKKYLKYCVCKANEVLQKFDMCKADDIKDKENVPRLQKDFADKLEYMINTLCMELKETPSSTLTHYDISLHSGSTQTKYYNIFYHTLCYANTKDKLETFNNVFDEEEMRSIDKELYEHLISYIRVPSTKVYNKKNIRFYSTKVETVNLGTELLFQMIKSIFRFISILILNLMTSGTKTIKKIDNILEIINTINQPKQIKMLTINKVKFKRYIKPIKH